MSESNSASGTTGAPLHASSGLLKRKPANRRLYLLLTVFAVLGICTIGIYWVRGNRPELPNIPAINLDGADPEIVKAIQAARAEIERAPRSVQAWGELAAVAHANGFDEAADTCYEAATRLDSGNPLWPYLRGYLHHNGPGGPLAALPHFERAVRLSKPDFVAQIRLADTLLELDRLDEAEQQYGKVLAANNRDAQALFGLGKLALARRQYEPSLRYLLPIAESRLVHRQACAMRAVVYERLGDHSQAERERRSLAQMPEDEMRPDDPIQHVIAREIGVQTLVRQGQKLWQQRRVDDVLEIAKKAAKQYADSDIAWASLSNVLVATNDLIGAEQALQKCISLAPKTAEYRLNLGKLQLSQHRYKEAEDSLQKSIELNPQDGQAHFSLGECLLAQGNRTGAAESFRSAIRHKPDLPQAQERLKELANDH